jgi:hypothetical protein
MVEESEQRHSGVSQHAVKQQLFKNTYVKVFLVYLAIALVMFWTVTIGITTRVSNGYGDIHQSLFNLWWVPYSLFTLHQSPYFTNLLFYPVGANLVTQTMSPLAGIVMAPIYALSPALAYNILYFTSFALSGLFMFMLAKYVTKNNYAAFIAGLIFAFSPTHIAQATSHLDWTIVEFIPLFLLFYLMALREKRMKYALLAAVSFVLLTFAGDIEQALLTFCIAAVVTVFLFISERKEMLNLTTLKMVGMVAAFTFVIASPFIALMLPHLTSGAFSSAQQLSGVVNNMEWSDNLASFFLPSFYNGIFNGIAHSYSYIYALTYQGISYQINVGERVSYLGYTVIALALFGLYYDYKQNRLGKSLLWIVLFVVFGWLALGPYLQIGTTVTGIPTIYMLYKDIPILNIIREPGRFDFALTIALAIMAAFGFAKLTEGKDRNTTYKYLAVVSLLILIEYNGMPLTPSYIGSSSIPTAIPSAYSEIGKLSGNFSVLILPALTNTSALPSLYTGTATYYVTAMKKPLVGGYTSRENATQVMSVSSVPIATAAWYLEQGAGLVYPSPIKQNFTNITTLFMAEDNIGFIAVQRDAYNLTEQEQLYGFLSSAYGQPVYQSNSTFMFSTTAAVSKNAGKSIASYTVGNWTPGYSLCAPGQCNATLGNMWWGQGPLGLVVFSPKDQNVAMAFEAMSYTGSPTLDLYLNNVQSPTSSLKLSAVPSRYAVNMTLSQGLNEIVFYSQQGGTTSIPYGIDNITITPS